MKLSTTMKSVALTGIVCVLLSMGVGLSGESPQFSAAAGRLTGRAVFDGPPPPPETLNLKANPYCVKAAGPDVSSEAVLIDQQGGLQNVFVYVKEGLDPRYSFDLPPAVVVLDQRGCQFAPRVLGLRAGQPLVIVNSDHTLHNVHARPSANQPFNIGQPIAGMRYTRVFTAPEVMIPLTSDINAWMAAFVGVMLHPFFAVTGPDGSFTISDIPSGSYVIEAWHEKFGTATERAIVDAGQTTTVSFTFVRRGPLP
jgi:hypothetical protein